MSTIDSSVDKGRQSAKARMVLLLLSLLFFLCQFQNANSFSHASISASKHSSQRGLSTLAIMGRNKSGSAENQVDNTNNKNVNSNTATMPGYTFFQRSGRRDGGSETKGNMGYVPSGMSREEYSAIRKMEAEKERKMNYGAWGPRFFRTERPDGDWMVMPNLWTFGQVDNTRQPVSNGVDGEMGGIRPSLRRRLQWLAQVNGPAFLLGYVLVDSLFFCYSLWRLKQMQDSAIIQKTYGLAFAVCRLLFSALGVFSGLAPRLQVLNAPVARKTIKSAILGPVAVSLIKINALKIAAATLQIPLWNGLMELSNRRWLWSRKRFTATITSAAIAGISIFGILLLR